MTIKLSGHIPPPSVVKKKIAFGEYETPKGKKKMGVWQNGKYLYKQGVDDF